MYQSQLKKTIFTLNLNPDVYKPITDLTYPLMKHYAHKIGAEFVEITERKFPEWKSPTYEKCQVWQLGQDMKNDWNIFFDADAIIHPETPDITAFLNKNQVLHNGKDFAGYRWRYDKYFLRDGRNIGSPTWLCVASDWTIDLFKPLDDLTPDEAYDNIFPVLGEVKGGIEPWRLIEDYVYSRNIAKYGLKFETFENLMKVNNFEGNYFWHIYMSTIDEKVRKMNEVLTNWGLK